MSRTLKVGLLLLALIGGLLIAAACGDDNGDGDDGDDEPTAVETMDDTGDGNGDGDEDGNGATDLSDLAGELQNQEMRVRYDFTSSVDGSAGSFVLYWKPPDRWRIDFIMDGEEGSFIQTADATYICSDDGSGGSCFSSPLGAEAIGLPFLSIFTDPTGLEDTLGDEIFGVDVDTSSDNIAGMDATCYSGSADEGTGEVCIGSDTPILLRIRATDTVSGDFEMVATEVETSVDDADLEPPYPVEEIPGFE